MAGKNVVSTTYRCDRCGRKLKHKQWVYSTHTKKRYCWPGKGCNK